MFRGHDGRRSQWHAGSLLLHAAAETAAVPKGGFVHPYELGSNVYCERVRREAIAAAKRLVKAVGYYGLITLEFRRDPRDQRLILIKADPRVVRPTSLSTALGMDTPTALYRLAVGSEVDVPQSYPEGIAWIWETTLLETLWNNRDVRPIREELLAIAHRRDRIKAFAYFSLRDPLPFIMHAQWRTLAFLRVRIRGLIRRCAKALGRDVARPANSTVGLTPPSGDTFTHDLPAPDRVQ